MMKKTLFILCAAMVILSSCKKDDEPSFQLKTQTLSIISGEKAQLKITPTTEGCTFTSENKYIANVSSEGNVTGITVGTTYVTVSNSAQKFSSKCKVTVTPKYNLFKEPYLGFGTTKSTVKAKEDRLLVSESSTGLIYTGENSNVSFVLYLFDDFGKMTGASVVFPVSKIYVAMDFLAERYIPLGYVDGYGIFMSNDEKMGVGISVYNSSYLMIIYTPITSTKSSNSNIKNQLIGLLNKFFYQ